MLTVEERVKNGVKFLDERVPNWRKRIELYHFSISSCSYCILGQLFGSFKEGIEELNLEGDDNNLCAELGFDAGYDADDDSFQNLQDAWLAELKKKV